MNLNKNKNQEIERYFHFTLGPVQSFVGQARRTRDFWAGSFLLSWLSGVAMQSVISHGGEILFPAKNIEFLNSIVNKQKEGPQQGSIPNRFKAKVDKNFNPDVIIENVLKAWKFLAYKIYSSELKFEEDISKQINHNEFSVEKVSIIWERQINNFWDISWAITSDINDSSILDSRKNWRTNFTPAEPGIKCSLMGEWQELSGIEGVRNKDRVAREKFWQLIQDKNFLGKTSDIVDKENLCAISYVKRRFYKYFPEIQVSLKGFKVYGWPISINVPSVCYIAGAPWYASILQESIENTELEEKICKFVSMASSIGGTPENASSINCMNNLSFENSKLEEDYKNIDGNYFFKIALDNPNVITPSQKVMDIKGILVDISNQTGKKPSPFYAVLMMDGDSLGCQMSNIEKQKDITKSLAAFTQEVPGIVKKHDGFLIYAGGDDVLALVTLEQAITCALSIRKHYEHCFAGKNNINTSISAAIIYTHINTPLKNVLHESHILLDDIAKEKTGRDALAVRVYKGSGLVLEWSSQWDEALDDSKEKLAISQLVKSLTKTDNENAIISTNFMYKIKKNKALFQCDKKSLASMEKNSNGLYISAPIQIMTMELLRANKNRKISILKAQEIVKLLLSQSFNPEGEITIDAALLIKFLASKGIDYE